MVIASISQRREDARSRGICIRCLSNPILFQRLHCRTCLMEQIIRESFKFDRKRSLKGSTQHRGSCYVEQFNLKNRKQWIEQIKSKWNNHCFYSGLPIEIGSTAGLNFMLPVFRAHVFGPDRVFHPDNLVWVDKRINLLKANMTADEFYIWLRKDLPAAIATTDK